MSRVPIFPHSYFFIIIYGSRAWETSLTLPISTLSPQPHLKISGIAILLGSVLEMGDRPKAAYEVYEQALTYLRDTVPASSTSSAPIPPEEPTDLLATEDERVLRLRAVALASKLGEMAEVYDLGNETEEKWLSWAVEEVLRVVAAASSTSPSSPSSSSWTTPGDVQGSNPLADLDLPPWIQKTDIGAPMEALGAFYARTGRFEYVFLFLFLPSFFSIYTLISSTKLMKSNLMDYRYAYTLYTRALGILLPGPSPPVLFLLTSLTGDTVSTSDDRRRSYVYTSQRKRSMSRCVLYRLQSSEVPAIDE